MNIGGQRNLVLDEFFVFKYLDEQFNKLIKHFLEKYPEGKIGVENIRFGRMYFEIAILVFRLYRTEFKTEQFNLYWNKRLKSDRRLVLHQDVKVQIDEIMLTSVSEFSETPFLALCDNVDLINNSSAINIGWNNGIEIDNKFIEKYLKRYFEEEIMPKYIEELTKFRELNSKEKAEQQFKYSIYGMDNKGHLNKEFWTLSFFTSITPDTILEYFQKFAEEHNMWVKSNSCNATIANEILEFSFGQN